MWLFTNIGFYSVVQKPEDELLTIRSRSVADLDKLRAEYMPELSPTIEGETSDYPFRARISHEKFGEGLAKIAESIHYGNFKAEIAVKMGMKRAQVYSKLWNDLLELEEADK